MTSKPHSIPSDQTVPTQEDLLNASRLAAGRDRELAEAAAQRRFGQELKTAQRRFESLDGEICLVRERRKELEAQLKLVGRPSPQN